MPSISHTTKKSLCKPLVPHMYIYLVPLYTSITIELPSSAVLLPLSIRPFPLKPRRCLRPRSPSPLPIQPRPLILTHILIPRLSRQPRRTPTPHPSFTKEHHLLLPRRFREPKALEEVFFVEQQGIGLRCYWDVDGCWDGILREFVGFADVDEERGGGRGFDEG
jgi:hypothetical protein